MSKFKAGDHVRLLVEKEPYGSNYARSPKVILPVGQEGIVGAVGCPSLYRNRDFICVDFELPGVYHFGIPRVGNQRWRCAAYPEEIEKI